MMTTSDVGIALIKRFEGCELGAYPDPGTGREPWTIGYGHTGSGVVPGLTISQDEADELLRDDLRWSEAAVRHLVTVPLVQHQFDALVSLVFNIGQGAFGASTLRRLLNAGDYAGAGREFDRWIKAGGVALPGLANRRAAERAMFEGETVEPAIV